MALKKLPNAFGLKPEQLGLETGDVEELAKLPFPHEFNTRENLNYKGPYPPLEMYGIKNMSTEDRAKTTAWYELQQGKVFDMQEQLEIYCTVDTSILRLACMTFRQLIIDITSSEGEDGEISYVDCFAHFTIASTVMQCFRLIFSKNITMLNCLMVGRELHALRVENACLTINNYFLVTSPTKNLNRPI